MAVIGPYLLKASISIPPKIKDKIETIEIKYLVRVFPHFTAWRRVNSNNDHTVSVWTPWAAYTHTHTLNGIYQRNYIKYNKKNLLKDEIIFRMSDINYRYFLDRKNEISGAFNYLEIINAAAAVRRTVGEKFKCYCYFTVILLFYYFMLIIIKQHRGFSVTKKIYTWSTISVVYFCCFTEDIKK